MALFPGSGRLYEFQASKPDRRRSVFRWDRWGTASCGMSAACVGARKDDPERGRERERARVKGRTLCCRTNDESKDLKNKQSKNRTSYSCMLRLAGCLAENVRADKNRKVRSTLGLGPPSKPQARSATKCLLDLQTRSGRLRLRW